MMTINPLTTGTMSYEATKATAETDELSRKALSADETELREVCEDFEAMFVKMMLDSMRKTLSDDTLIPKNQGEKLFEDELYGEYAKSISQTANLGLADMMYSQLSDKNVINPGDILDLGV